MLKKVLYALIFLGIVIAVSPLYIKRGIFRNLSDVTDYRFFDNAVVKAGQPEPWNIGQDYNQRQPSEKHLKEIEDNKTIAFLVIQNDSIRYERYWRGYSDSSLSASFSMAKSMVSLMMGIALEEGKIKSIEDPVAKYVPEFDREGTNTIKIRDLLTMSGGLDWTESYYNIFGRTANIYYGNDVKKVIQDLRLVRKPGTEFYYASNETQILGWIIENAYGRPLPELFSEKIWSRIGAEHDALWSLDKKGGVAKTFCCVNSNARDFARLGKLVLQNGSWDSTQIVPAAYIREATTPASWIKDENGQPVDFYGYQFWIMRHKGLTIPYFRGVKGQLIFVIPEKNAIVVRLGEYISQTKINHHSVNSYAYLDAALEVLK